MPGHTVYLWTPTVKLWPPLGHGKPHKHIKTIKQFNTLFHNNFWKIHKANKWNRDSQETRREAKRIEGRKAEVLKYTIVPSAKSASKSRLTCFRTKFETFSNVDPWKLMPDKESFSPGRKLIKKRRRKTGSNWQMVI